MDRPLRPPLEVQQPERVGRLPQSLPGGIICQVKLDGWRCLAFVGEHDATIQTRSGRLVTSHFPELSPVLGTLPAGTVLDGEVVAIRGGAFDFHALAKPPKARGAAGVAISYAAFDVLHDGARVIGQRAGSSESGEVALEKLRVPQHQAAVRIGAAVLLNRADQVLVVLLAGRRLLLRGAGTVLELRPSGPRSS